MVRIPEGSCKTDSSINWIKWVVQLYCTPVEPTKLHGSNRLQAVLLVRTTWKTPSHSSDCMPSYADCAWLTMQHSQAWGMPCNDACLDVGDFIALEKCFMTWEDMRMISHGDLLKLLLFTKERIEVGTSHLLRFPSRPGFNTGNQCSNSWKALFGCFELEGQTMIHSS